MIQRIRPSKYLADIRTMTKKEQKDYLKRVGEWLTGNGQRLTKITDRPMALAQNVVQLSIRWSKEECQAFSDGTLLLTALMNVTDTWMPMQLYSRNANKAVRHIIECFNEALREPERQSRGQVPGSATAGTSPHNISVPSPQSQAQSRAQSRGQVPGSATTGTSPHNCPSPHDLQPVRPKHIDGYVHLLPEKTQERAAQYGPLMREFDSAREKLRLLVNDPHSSARDREAWAKRITAIDKQVKAIRTELDREWDALVKKGGVVVDDLGNARVVKTNDKGEMINDKRDEGAVMTEEEKELKERQKKALLLRKWLIDKRNAKTEKQKEKWLKKYQEMVSLGGEDTVTDKVREAAKYYGIDLTACLSPCDENTNDKQ